MVIVEIFLNCGAKIKGYIILFLKEKNGYLKELNLLYFILINYK